MSRTKVHTVQSHDALSVAHGVGRYTRVCPDVGLVEVPHYQLHVHLVRAPNLFNGHLQPESSERST